MIFENHVADALGFFIAVCLLGLIEPRAGFAGLVIGALYVYNSL